MTENMRNWLIQEDHNTGTIFIFEAINKVIQNYENGANIFHGLTHIVYSHVKIVTQVAFEIGMALLVTTIEPSLTISTPISSICTYVPHIMTTSI